MFKVPNQYRQRRGPYATTDQDGNNGYFLIDRGRTQLAVIASDGAGWQHVSVHAITDNKDRTPTWAEMCYGKDLFWSPEDCCIQYHPSKAEYINLHKHTLHLWRPINQIIPIPDKSLIGF